MTISLPKEVTEALKRATKQMAKASALIKEGEAIKKEVKEETAPLMIAHGLSKFALDGVGKMAVKQGRGSTINEAKLTEALLHEGIEAERVVEIIEGARKTWTYDCIEFRVK